MTLGGSGSDPDGDTLSYAWEQTGGMPSVELRDANTATVSFTAPEVAADSELTFSLTVTDPGGLTGSDTVTVRILQRRTNQPRWSPVDLRLIEYGYYNWTDVAGGHFSHYLPWAADGDGELTYSLTPEVPGLSFDPTTHEVSGTPTSVGTYRMTYKATDEDGDEAVLKMKWLIRDSCVGPHFGELDGLGYSFTRGQVGLVVREYDDKSFPASIWHPDNLVISHEFMHVAGYRDHSMLLGEDRSLVGVGDFIYLEPNFPPYLRRQGTPHLADQKWAKLMYEPTFALGTSIEDILGGDFLDTEPIHESLPPTSGNWYISGTLENSETDVPGEGQVRAYQKNGIRWQRMAAAFVRDDGKFRLPIPQSVSEVTLQGRLMGATTETSYVRTIVVPKERTASAVTVRAVPYTGLSHTSANINDKGVSVEEFRGFVEEGGLLIHRWESIIGVEILTRTPPEFLNNTGSGSVAYFSPEEQEHIANKVMSIDDVGALFGGFVITNVRKNVTTYSPKDGWITVIPIPCK